MRHCQRVGTSQQFAPTTSCLLTSLLATRCELVGYDLVYGRWASSTSQGIVPLEAWQAEMQGGGMCMRAAAGNDESSEQGQVPRPWGCEQAITHVTGKSLRAACRVAHHVHAHGLFPSRGLPSLLWSSLCCIPCSQASKGHGSATLCRHNGVADAGLLASLPKRR